MVLPIGFFAPLPLAIMIPFMAAQSFAMGMGFGTSFQYGKRKISSMSNEEFNAATPVSIHEDLQADIRAMIPSMNASFHRMEQFQIDILDSMGRTLIKAVERFFGIIGPTGFSGSGAGPGGVNPYVGTGGPGGGFSFEDITGLTPGSEYAPAGEDSGITPAITDVSELSPYEKWAARWINYIRSTANFTSATIAELRFMLDKISAGQGGKTTKWRSTILQIWEQKIKDKPPKDTPDEAIVKSGATGLVKEIAIQFNSMKVALANMFRTNFTSAMKNQNKKFFFIHAKKYNQLVAQNRMPNLQIDTAKSIAARRLIPKL